MKIFPRDVTFRKRVNVFHPMILRQQSLSDRYVCGHVEFTQEEMLDMFYHLAEIIQERIHPVDKNDTFATLELRSFQIFQTHLGLTRGKVVITKSDQGIINKLIAILRGSGMEGNAEKIKSFREENS